MTVDPNTIIQILGSAAAFALIKFYDARRERRARAKLQEQAEEATRQAKEAAVQGESAARQSSASKQNSFDVGQQLQAITNRLIETEESREREAGRFNDLWNAYLKQSSYLEHQRLPQRVRAIEQFFADIENQQHKETTSEHR